MYKFTALVFLAAAVLHPAHVTSEYVPADVRAAVYETLAILAAAGLVWCLIETIYRSFSWGWGFDIDGFFDRLYRRVLPGLAERLDLTRLKRRAKSASFKLLWSEDERDVHNTVSRFAGVSCLAWMLCMVFTLVAMTLGQSTGLAYIVTGLSSGLFVVAITMEERHMKAMVNKYRERYETEFETVPLYDQKQRLTGVAVRSRNGSEPVYTVARESA